MGTVTKLPKKEISKMTQPQQLIPPGEDTESATDKVARVLRSVATFCGLGALIVDDVKALKKNPRKILDEAKARGRQAVDGQ